MFLLKGQNWLFAKEQGGQAWYFDPLFLYVYLSTLNSDLSTNDCCYSLMGVKDF